MPLECLLMHPATPRNCMEGFKVIGNMVLINFSIILRSKRSTSVSAMCASMFVVGSTRRNSFWDKNSSPAFKVILTDPNNFQHIPTRHGLCQSLDYAMRTTVNLSTCAVDVPPTSHIPSGRILSSIA